MPISNPGSVVGDSPAPGAPTSFLTEISDSASTVTDVVDRLRGLGTLYEDDGESQMFSSPLPARPPSETGSEFDTDLEDEPETKTEYDSSGIDLYLKICEGMTMRPVTQFMRQTKNPCLSLKYQSLGCKNTVAITRALASNTHVERLDLSDADIGCDGMISVANMLTENYFITDLNLKDNKIGESGVASLCKVLSSHSYVKRLSLSGNALGNGAATLVSEMLQQNYTLSSLNLCNNQISCVGAKALASALVGNDTLSEVDLSSNRISRRGSESLGKMVAVNSGLLSLNLRSNGLDLAGANSFIKAIKQNGTLLNLDITNTRFPGKLSKELAKALTVNETLKILRFGRNPFKEEELEVLMASLAASSLHIIGLEDLSVSKGLYERLQEFERDNGIIIHYGHSGGYQRGNPMSGQALLLEEFMITNLSKLVPLFVARSGDTLTVSQFKEVLMEGEIPLSEVDVQKVLDRFKFPDGIVPVRELLKGKIAVNLMEYKKAKGC